VVWYVHVHVRYSVPRLSLPVSPMLCFHFLLLHSVLSRRGRRILVLWGLRRGGRGVSVWGVHLGEWFYVSIDKEQRGGREGGSGEGDGEVRPDTIGEMFTIPRVYCVERKIWEDGRVSGPKGIVFRRGIFWLMVSVGMWSGRWSGEWWDRKKVGWMG